MKNTHIYKLEPERGSSEYIRFSKGSLACPKFRMLLINICGWNFLQYH